VISDKNSLFGRVSVGEKALVCQGGECHKIWWLGGKLSLLGSRGPLIVRGRRSGSGWVCVCGPRIG